MEHLIHATVRALNDGNWYAALTVALTLPDICGKLQNPDVKSPGVRYRAWCEEYLMPAYPAPGWVVEKGKPFLTAVDVFSLRCAYLHAGDFELDEAKIRTALNRFQFRQPPKNGAQIHKNVFADAMQLQVDLFCLEMCNGVHEWLKDHENDLGIQKRMSMLGHID